MKIELQQEINVKDILTSGACFRARVEEDGSITNIKWNHQKKNQLL